MASRFMIDPPSHEPAGYRCPFCVIAGGAESEFTAWRDEHALVQIALPWNPANPGKALVIPLAHIENIYTLPDELAGRIAHMVRRVAVAIRTGYPCDGVTVRQNNEPAGGQDVWHLHTHVIPRYIGDGKYIGVFVRADGRDRARASQVGRWLKLARLVCMFKSLIEDLKTLHPIPWPLADLMVDGGSLATDLIANGHGYT